MDAVIVCSTCNQSQRVGELRPGTAAECCRCGSVIAERRSGSLELTAALALAALILYIPANLYPILSMNLHGVYSESTVWDGVVSLFRSGQRMVAMVVFFASILIPLFKLITLFLLVAMAKFRSTRWQRARTQIYQFLGVIGPWAMLDVFLLAILVALVKLQQLATILPGTGLVAFTAMVVLTILATLSFDPKLIWNETEAIR
jgi:paraquat-inducible protein A